MPRARGTQSRADRARRGRGGGRHRGRAASEESSVLSSVPTDPANDGERMSPSEEDDRDEEENDQEEEEEEESDGGDNTERASKYHE